MSLLGLAIIAFSSVTATECVARVKGGSGTVQDSLRIEVEGNAGLTPFLDSLLPFRAISAIQLSYVGERFYIPGINDYFSSFCTEGSTHSKLPTFKDHICISQIGAKIWLFQDV